MRVCTPVLHVVEHEPHLPHFESTQSSGQACALHLCSPTCSGQALPPLAGLRKVHASHVYTPPPQAFEHGVHCLSR